MEPAWMKKFSNNTVCNFFYFWFVVYAVFALMALFLTIGTFFSIKKLDFFGVMVVLQPFITLLLATAFMMFYYIICDRSLLAKVSESVVQEGFEGGKLHKEM
jgi:glucan phosphoethanolaminetransferase (alkaline phosphatase superfamily)